MATPVLIQVTCPRCGAQVPGLEPGQRRPCPYCKTELAMPRLDPTQTEMPRVIVADARAGRRGGCLVVAILGLTFGLVAVIGGAAVWMGHRAQVETTDRINETIDQARRAQQAAMDQARAAQDEARAASRAARREACERRATVRCERECRLRPATCAECQPRELAACASP